MPPRHLHLDKPVISLKRGTLNSKFSQEDLVKAETSIIIRAAYRIVSYRIERYDTIRYARLTIRYDTIRYGAIRYRFALKKRKYAIRYDAIRPNATAIRPANDTIRYDTPEKVGKYVSFVSFVSYRSVSHSSG